MSPATCASPPRGQRTGSFDLRNRIKAARNALAHCDLCEWHCGVDRTRGESAPCRLSDETRCFRRYLSFAEEPELIPAYRVYLAGCNFRCRFCDTGPTCFDPHSGLAIEPGMFAAELQVAIKQGARSVQLLGGEPSLHPHTILELAEAADGKLPIVLDTNLYMTPQVLDWLLDVLTWVVGDFKFGNDNCARSLAGVERYWSVVTRNLLHVASSTTPLLVRHLLMPGHFDCCFRPVADWSSKHLPGVRFELSTAYVPCWRSATDERIGRVNKPAEVTAARKYLSGLNLRTGATTDG